MMDWISVWRYANQISEGATFSSLKKQGLIQSNEDKEAFKEALKDPDFYKTQCPDPEGGVCAMSPELFMWFDKGIEPASWAETAPDEMDDEQMEKAYSGGSRSDAARYAAQVRWKGHQKKQQVPQQSKRLGRRFDPKNRRKAVLVKSPKKALQEIARGNLVEMESVEEAYTALDKLGEFIKDLKKEGKETKINVCKISVPGTNLFCGESIKTDKHPEGVPREKMPQLSGIPIKGSRADKMPRIDDEGNVDIGPLFVEHLSKQDPPIRMVEAEVPASSLRASQSELKGKTVAYMMSDEGAKTLDDPKAVIYVSRDGYVIDGHHRWAGKIGRDLADGKTGDVKIRVRRIDMPIMEVLDAALDFTETQIEAKQA